MPGALEGQQDPRGPAQEMVPAGSPDRADDPHVGVAVACSDRPARVCRRRMARLHQVGEVLGADEVIEETGSSPGARDTRPRLPPMRRHRPSSDCSANQVIDLALEVVAHRGIDRGLPQPAGAVPKRRAGVAKANDVKTPKTVTFRFQRDEHYRLIPVNGIWGGVTPRGDVIADLIHESQALPEAITHEVTAEGTLAEVKRAPPTSFQRTVLAGMVLTPEQAESIGLWLQRKAREAREQRDARAPGKEGGDSEPDTPTTH